MLNLPRILAGLLLSTLIGFVAYRRGSLSASGWLGAIITGTLTFGFGGWAWGLTLIVFFISSSLLSRFKQADKERVAGEKFEKGGRRDLLQTLANGGAGGLFALLFGLSGEPLALLALYAGVMATVTADTWATELGVLSRSAPRLVTTWRKVAPGTSGGVTTSGTLAGVGGSLLIGLTLLVLVRVEYGNWAGWLVPAALLGGVAGSLADSLLGATVQAMYHTPAGHETERSQSNVAHRLVRGWRWMNNDAVNFCSSLAGAAVAYLVFAILA